MRAPPPSRPALQGQRTDRPSQTAAGVLCWSTTVTPSLADRCTHGSPGAWLGLNLSSHLEAGSTTGVETWGLGRETSRGLFPVMEQPRPGSAQDMGLPPLLWDSGASDPSVSAVPEHPQSSFPAFEAPFTSRGPFFPLTPCRTCTTLRVSLYL